MTAQKMHTAQASSISSGPPKNQTGIDTMDITRVPSGVL